MNSETEPHEPTEPGSPGENTPGDSTPDGGTHHAEAGTGSHGKARPAYFDASGSEASRELRDTARRRRDSEEKLQQHLMAARDHVPNEEPEEMLGS